MKIAIIGAGNVGGTLANGLGNAGHQIFIGARTPTAEKVQVLVKENITAHTVSEASQLAEVIIITAPASATKNIAERMRDVSEKIIIDAMNSVGVKAEPYSNTGIALMEWTNCKHVVKCFNTTGYEIMADPIYVGRGIDMFIAGDSKTGKKIATQLATDLGFEKVYDLGGSDKFELIEQFALCWITLAIIQGYGRNIAFKVLKRPESRVEIVHVLLIHEKLANYCLNC